MATGREQTAKENAERYIVTTIKKVNVWAEDYEDLMAELKQSGIDPDEEVIRIQKLDF